MSQLRVCVLVVGGIDVRIGFGDIYMKGIIKYGQLLLQCLISHLIGYEVNSMKAMIRITDIGMGSSMYWCFLFPHSEIKVL
jgi:hypothetical protein